MKMRCMVAALCGTLILAEAVAEEAIPGPEPSLHPSQPVTRLTATQTIYLQYCGGCHGIHGVSAPRDVPSLRHQVASFLCTREGREYLVRLPNVALAPISNEELAKLMNYVVFELGGSDAAALKASPFSAAEVAGLRKRALTGTGLSGYRARIVRGIIERCDSGAGLQTYDLQRRAYTTADAGSAAAAH